MLINYLLAHALKKLIIELADKTNICKDKENFIVVNDLF